MPLITKISSQKKAKARYNIFLDGKYAFPVSEKVLVSAKLKEGESITQKRIKEVLEDENFEKIYYKVLNFLTYRVRSEHEVKVRLGEYLYKAGIKKEISKNFEERIITSLNEQGLLNDEEFVKSYISDSKNAKKPLGKRKIQQFLLKRGVSHQLVEAHLEKYSHETELKGAQQVADKKIANLKGKLGYKEKQKIWKFLAGKGYSPEVINTVVDSRFEV